jgi:hypothetical protein
MEGGSARHWGHDADSGENTRYPFAEGKLLTTSIFSAIRMEKSATTFQKIAIHSISFGLTSDI